jgi:hypothetical protein
MQGAAAELKRRPVGALGARSRARRLATASWVPPRGDLIGAAVAAIGSVLAATFSLQLWRAHLHVPLAYGSDALLTQMLVKSVVTGGWVWHIHGLGAPLGNQLFDFPVATDDLNFLTMKILGLVTSDSAKVMNVWFLLTFPAEAITGYAVLRWLGVSRLCSIVCAILFADSPYHLLRGEVHLLLSEYVSIPIATYMIVSVLRGSRLFRRHAARTGTRSWLSARNVAMVVLCLIIGSLGVYYAVFAILLIGVAGVLSSAGRRAWSPVLQAALLVAIIGGMSFVNDIPAALYRHDHGIDHLVADRLPQESELYALKLVEMVLPPPGDRIGAFRSLRYRYDTTTPVPSEDGQQALGIVGSLGLGVLLLVGLAAVAGLGRGSEWFSRQREISFAALTAFLVGTLGGVSALLAYIFSSQIRGWDRISIFIDFFALAAVGLSLDAVGRRLLGWRRFAGRGRIWLLAALALVLVVGVYDQSTLTAIPPYYANGVAYGNDALFVGQIQRLMPRQASIFQLPYVPFPENPPVGRMLDYDLGRGYVQTTDGLSWSYGAIKGRPQDWQGATASLPLPTLVDGVVAAGFSGIWIDTYGYADNGAAVVDGIRALIGQAPMVSRNQREVFFDLRPYAARLRAASGDKAIAALGSAILHPPGITYGNGVYPPDPNGNIWTTPDAIASISNATGRARRMIFYASVQTAGQGHFHLTITAPDGTVKHVAIGHSPKIVRFEFIDPIGTHGIGFASDAPITPIASDPRQLAVYYANPVIGDASLAPFLPGALAASGH